MSSAIVNDKKYEETVYHYKKPDTSDINIKIGSRIYVNNEYYGTVVKESEIFYYIQKKNVNEPYEFMRESLELKVANGILQLEND